MIYTNSSDRTILFFTPFLKGGLRGIFEQLIKQYKVESEDGGYLKTSLSRLRSTSPLKKGSKKPLAMTVMIMMFFIRYR